MFVKRPPHPPPPHTHTPPPPPPSPSRLALCAEPQPTFTASLNFIDIWEFHTCLASQLHTFKRAHTLILDSEKHLPNITEINHSVMRSNTMKDLFGDKGKKKQLGPVHRPRLQAARRAQNERGAIVPQTDTVRSHYDKSDHFIVLLSSS